jgi:hypothetical protein
VGQMLGMEGPADLVATQPSEEHSSGIRAERHIWGRRMQYAVTATRESVIAAVIEAITE